MATDGINSGAAKITEAVAAAVGAPGAVAGSDAEASARLGDYFADVMLLDQATDARRARTELGWAPSHPTLVEEFRDGYRRAWALRDGWRISAARSLISTLRILPVTVMGNSSVTWR